MELWMFWFVVFEKKVAKTRKQYVLSDNHILNSNKELKNWVNKYCSVFVKEVVVTIKEIILEKWNDAQKFNLKNFTDSSVLYAKCSILESVFLLHFHQNNIQSEI